MAFAFGSSHGHGWDLFTIYGILEHGGASCLCPVVPPESVAPYSVVKNLREDTASSWDTPEAKQQRWLQYILNENSHADGGSLHIRNVPSPDPVDGYGEAFAPHVQYFHSEQDNLDEDPTHWPQDLLVLNTAGSSRDANGAPSMLVIGEEVRSFLAWPVSLPALPQYWPNV